MCLAFILLLSILSSYHHYCLFMVFKVLSDNIVSRKKVVYAVLEFILLQFFLLVVIMNESECRTQLSQCNVNCQLWWSHGAISSEVMIYCVCSFMVSFHVSWFWLNNYMILATLAASHFSHFAAWVSYVPGQPIASMICLISGRCVVIIYILLLVVSWSVLSLVLNIFVPVKVSSEKYYYRLFYILFHYVSTCPFFIC